MPHLFIYLVGLQTKGKFACPYCGSRIKSRHSRSLVKEVFDEYRHFLHKNHSYQTTDKAKFNGKEGNGKKPQRMTPRLWKLEYIINFQGTEIKYV
jgi:DNA-directed RNA polymerase subunit RPC12/RpoP